LTAKRFRAGGTDLTGRFGGRGSEKGSQQHSGNIQVKFEELLQNPEVKDRVIANLACLEPEKARELVKILLWSDSAFSFGMLGQLPRSLNFLVSFLDELGLQLQNIPPHLFREFICQMTSAVDYESIQKLPRAYLPLLDALKLSDHKTSSTAAPADFHERVNRELEQNSLEELAALINGLVRLANNLLAKHPGLPENALQAFFSSLDRKEIENLCDSIIFKSGLFSQETLLQFFPPEDAGEYLNNNLKKLNRQLAEEPARVVALASPYLGYLDPEELTKTCLLLSARASEALATNPGLSRSLLKSFFRLAWGLFRGSLRSSKKKYTKPNHEQA
jgi:hypothetical protein